MITREADYAIRTVLHLARCFNQGPVSTMEISEKMEIPYRFLRKISHHLVEAKIIKATRGKQGGIFLNVSPEKLSFLDILKIFDERAINLNICCKSDNACSMSSGCPVHGRLVLLQKKIQAEFADLKFSDLIDKC